MGCPDEIFSLVDGVCHWFLDKHMLTILDGPESEAVVCNSGGADINKLNVRVTENLVWVRVVWYAVKFADLSGSRLVNI